MGKAQVVAAGAERLDELEPLYRSLHRHHREIAAIPVVADGVESWRRRRAWYADMLARGALLLVAELDARPAGYAMVELRPGDDDTWPVGARYAELQSLVVEDGLRGAGIGGILMDAVEAELAARGVADLSVAVLAGNDAALRFYERRGLRVGELMLWRFGPPGGDE